MKSKYKSNSKKEQPKKPVSTNHLLKGHLGEIWGKGKWKNLFAPVDISSIVLFRIIFGLIMFIEVCRYFKNDWIRYYWIEPKLLFSYWPFDFLKALPGDGMIYLFFLMGVLALCILFGFFYRIATTLFFVFFTYTFLLEQTLYLNHFYLVALISFIMIFIPANTSGSLDSILFKRIKSETAPAWSLWLIRFMIGITYFFGGIAKINSDWLQGEPLRMWISNQTQVPIIGPLLQYDWMIYFMVYSGLILDLFIVPALLFKQTRKWGFLLITLFHLLNTQLFTIGIFPWFMIAATTIYFDPSWVRKLKNGISLNSWPLAISELDSPPTIYHLRHKLILSALFCWISIQVLLPIRHFFIPGSVHWTEQGHHFAWHMKLRTKRGKAVYTAKDRKTGQEYIINPKDYLLQRQISKLNRDPYLIWQFCQYVKKDFQQKGMDVAIYANVSATLNGRAYQQMIDSSIDLTSVPRPILPATWIVPLQTPLNKRLQNDSDKNSSED